MKIPKTYSLPADLIVETPTLLAIVRHGRGNHTVRYVVKVNGAIWWVTWATESGLTLQEARDFIGNKLALAGIWQEPKTFPHPSNLLEPV